MQHLTSQQLEQLQKRGDDLTLINVLPKNDFAKERIPRSANIPLEEKDFEAIVARRVGNNKTKPVVIYCGSKECAASKKAAERLEKAGFKNVYTFDGGLKEWKETGHQVERGPGGPTH